MRISCRASSQRPHQLTYHCAFKEPLPERGLALVRPVGCMHELDGAPHREGASDGRLGSGLAFALHPLLTGDLTLAG
jgi:hypothetical protein